MVKRSLTDAAVKRLKPPEAGQIDVFDQGFPGLALRVSYGGRKAWTFHYRVGPKGKLRRLTLGTYPALSLAEAREAWRAARTAAQGGRDPADARARETGATDFRNVFDEWLKRDQSGNRSHDAVKRLIEKDAMPAWQYRSVLDLGRRDILDVVDAVVDRGSPITARRLHAHLHRLFKWCAQRGILPSNPMADLPKPGRETKRERVLAGEELKAVWKAADEIGWPFGPAIQLLILTGARRGEIAGLRWSEIKDANLHLPGERTKNGEPLTIPLSEPAVALIEALPKVEGSDFVFTTTGKTPISGWTRAKIDLGEIADLTPWTIHDIRRTVSTGMNELGIEPHIVEAVLGHKVPGVAGVYNRAKYEAAKRTALQAWAGHIEALLGKRASNVLALRG